jgi:fructose-bisphosphate aldolase class II
MIDASANSLSENMHLTQEVVAMARASGVAVEGELGYVPGVEGDYVALHPGEVVYTTPAQAKTYVERTHVDSLAVSVGTVHGRLQGTARLDYTRLGKINEALGIPLVIHGGTGLTDDQFRRLIAHGVAKINYYTGLSDVAGAAVARQSAAGEKGYTALTHGVRDAVREEVERCMRIWGSSGRAAEVLSQCRPWQEIEHVVLFNVDGRLDGSEVASQIARGKRAMEEIPGVRSVVHGTAQQPEARYQHCWLIRFASEAVIPVYRDHPEHLNYADSMFRLATSDRITTDYKLAN